MNDSDRTRILELCRDEKECKIADRMPKLCPWQVKSSDIRQSKRTKKARHISMQLVKTPQNQMAPDKMKLTNAEKLALSTTTRTYLAFVYSAIFYVSLNFIMPLVQITLEIILPSTIRSRSCPFTFVSRKIINIGILHNKLATCKTRVSIL
jgi:hypothetical protein